MSDAPTIGFLGGTGIEGRGLALRFAGAGLPLTIGSRSPERAREVSRQLNLELGSDLIAAAENAEMIGASEIVLLTVPFEQATGVVELYRENFREGSILVDATVPVKFAGGQARFVEMPEGSSSEAVAKRLPSSIPVAAAFKTIPAHVLADLQTPLDCDVFVCGESQPAKDRVMEVIKWIPTLRPVDAGGLETARTLERMTVLAIGINRRYKIHSARFRVVGL